MTTAAERRHMERCPICTVEYQRFNSMRKTCNDPICRKESKRQVELKKAERKAIRVRKEAIKTPKELAKEAEVAVNRYARIRDRELGCVSCDRPATWDGQWHASHFKSVGANSALRFNLWNIHKSCSICNNHLSGNIDEYRRRLPAKIGADRVEWLDNHPRSRRYSDDYLRRMKSIFTKRAKRLEKRQA